MTSPEFEPAPPPDPDLDAGPPFGPEGPPPPPRPTTPPVRRGFLVVLGGLCLAAGLVFGIPYVLERAGHAYEAGRARAASEALERLDKKGIIDQSALFRLAIQAVAPSVVKIETWRTLKRPPRGPGLPPTEHGEIRTGIGSGFVVDRANGYVVTNGHVVQDADRITVRLGRSARELPAQLVNGDSKTDLAVLKVDAQLPSQAEWGDSDRLEIGDWVLAIGSPFELDQTVTAGIVSATGRNHLQLIGEGSYQDFIQTDAAINPGNSGGPLIDLRGRVVGVNTAIYSPASGPDGGAAQEATRGNLGIGFAISATLARRVADQLIKNQRVVRGYIGVALRPLDPARAQEVGLAEPAGVLVADVDPGGPADRAGLRGGEIVVGLGGKPIASLFDLRNRIAMTDVGAAVPLDIVGPEGRRTVEVLVAALPILRSLGVLLVDPPADPTGGPLVEQVSDNSPARRAELRRGMRIVAVGDKAVRTRDEAEEAVAGLDLRKGIPLRVRLADGREVPLRLGGAGPARQPGG